MYKIMHGLDELKAELGDEYLDELKKRFSYYLISAKTFLLEHKYVDREWREEYSILYSFTFYEDITPFTQRLHFFKAVFRQMEDLKDIPKDRYLGYVVFRPAPAPNRILKAVLKPEKKAFGLEKGDKLWMSLCRFDPHIGGEEFQVETFPFYSQDSMVTVCAQACMYMNALFVHEKYGLNRPSFRDFIKLTPPLFGRVVPSQGLSPMQMVAILVGMGYNATLDRFEATKPKELDACFRQIDSCVESALPPLVIFGEHVITLVGYALKKGEKNYIAFDDSGFHLKKLVNVGYFGYKIPKEILRNALRQAKEVFLINFEFERQYFPLNSVQRLVNSSTGVELDGRILLVDSRKFKVVNKKNKVEAFDSIGLPHYLWIFELYDGKKLFCEFIVDASAHQFDFKTSLIAMWFERTINLYKPNDILINVGAFPLPFSNLGEVKE